MLNYLSNNNIIFIILLSLKYNFISYIFIGYFLQITLVFCIFIYCKYSTASLQCIVPILFIVRKTYLIKEKGNFIQF